MHAAFNKVLLRDKIDRIPTRVLSRIPAAFLRGALFLQKIIYMAFSLSFFFSVDFRREPNFEASITLDECLKNWIKPKIFLFRFDQTATKKNIWALGKMFAQIILRKVHFWSWIEYCGLKPGETVPPTAINNRDPVQSLHLFGDASCPALFKVDKSFLVSGAVAWMVDGSGIAVTPMIGSKVLLQWTKLIWKMSIETSRSEYHLQGCHNQFANFVNRLQSAVLPVN